MEQKMSDQDIHEKLRLQAEKEKKELREKAEKIGKQIEEQSIEIGDVIEFSGSDKVPEGTAEVNFKGFDGSGLFYSYTNPNTNDYVSAGANAANVEEIKLLKKASSKEQNHNQDIHEKLRLQAEKEKKELREKAEKIGKQIEEQGIEIGDVIEFSGSDKVPEGTAEVNFKGFDGSGLFYSYTNPNTNDYVSAGANAANVEEIKLLKKASKEQNRIKELKEQIDSL